MIKLKLKSNHGQTLPFMCLIVLALAMFWMLVVNMGVMIRDRIIVQNAADCAAQTAACFRARALNMVGAYNAVLGTYIFYEGSKGLPPQGAWIPYADANYTYNFTRMMNGITDYVRSYGGGYAKIKATEVAKKSGADGLLSFPGSGMYSLGLKVDKVRIRFWSTVVVYGVPVPAPPCIAREVYTWYYLKDNYGPRKNIAIAYKKAQASFFPLGKKIFGISKIPEILAISAARPYNTKGSMFPEKKTKWGLSVFYEWYKASNGGWEAHLVPVGNTSIVPTGLVIKH